jgi:hypothetical protein
VVAVVAGAPELVLEVVQGLEPALQVFAKPAGSRAGRGFARRVEHASGGSVRKGQRRKRCARGCTSRGVDMRRVPNHRQSGQSRQRGGTTARCDDRAHPMRRLEDMARGRIGWSIEHPYCSERLKAR